MKAKNYNISNEWWMWCPEIISVVAKSPLGAISQAVKQVRQCYRDGAASTKSHEIQDWQFRITERNAQTNAP